MYLLTPSAFTRRVVANPRMLHPGGEVKPGTYERTRRNVVMSAGLKARNAFTARVMPANCSQRDKCLPRGMSHAAVGSPVPGNPGKVYTDCDDAERARRLADARACAMRELATKGGVYSKAPAAA